MNLDYRYCLTHSYVTKTNYWNRMSSKSIKPIPNSWRKDCRMLFERKCKCISILPVFYTQTFFNHRRLCGEIVQECSAAVHSIDQFSSTTSIAPNHDEIVKEREHPSLRPFIYHRFWLDGKGSAPPRFGVSREKQLELLLDILKPDQPVCCLRSYSGAIYSLLWSC